MTDNQLTAFRRMVQVRSREHETMMAHAVATQSWASAGELLRLELDSLLRLEYLKAQPPERGEEILRTLRETSRFGTRSPGGKVERISDRTLVRASAIGWVAIVYDFGCEFVHLTHMHGYQDLDPFQALAPERRREIVDYLNKYHWQAFGGPATPEDSFERIMAYAPLVLKKITTNIEIL